MPRHARLLRAKLTALLTLLAIAEAAAGGPLEDAFTDYQRGDYAHALRLLRPLADQGNATAQFNLGLMYSRGKGIPQNYPEAAKWYRLSAAQGNTGAQVNLGWLYGRGEGVRQDYTEAGRWYRLAADQGDATAQFNLGWAYVNGFGVPRDYVRAYMWYNLSAGQGDKKASHDRDRVAALMAPAQIVEAQKAAREWHPRPPQQIATDNASSDWRRIGDALHREGQRRLLSGAEAGVGVEVPLTKERGTFVVPVQINGAITLDFNVDSGAADVSVPADVFSTLTRTGTIRDTDIIGEQTYVLADGAQTKSTTFTIRSLKVGDLVIENVIGGVLPMQGSLLLGQSFLERFKSWSVDNTKHVLHLEPQ
jgi:clan AA aspartic protease (TIGR02281 family)